MKTSLHPLVRCVAISAIASLVVIASAEVQAQAPKIFVASYGNDANSGTPASPKRAFQAALNAVAPGGQIVALDTAGYGALNITKSVNVVVPPGVTGFVTVSGASNGVTINAGPDAVVSLRGLIIENSNRSGEPRGIHSDSVGTLTVEDCAIRNFFRGISFNQANEGHLQVHGGSVRGNTHGIVVQPTAAVALDAIVTGCLLQNNTAFGCYALSSSGGTAVMRMSDCTITNNWAGVADGVLSRGNNTLENNTSNNTFTATYSAK